MFNGPSLESMTPGASFGKFTPYQVHEGVDTYIPQYWYPDQSTGSTPQNYFTAAVGLGNTVLLLCSTNFLATGIENNTDVQYIDVALLYSFAMYDISTYPFRFPENFDASLIEEQAFCSTDIMPEYDNNDPHCVRLNHRYRYHRFINPYDVDSGAVLASRIGYFTGFAQSTAFEIAVGDYVSLFYRVVAADPAQQAILREGETFQFALATGATARTL